MAILNTNFLTQIHTVLSVVKFDLDLKSDILIFKFKGKFEMY